jgi:hypothetical protein
MAGVNPTAHAHNFEDLTGRPFGLLTVIECAGRRADGKILWRCRCSCGRMTVTAGKYLRKGETGSCGCRVKRGMPEVDAARMEADYRGGMSAVTCGKKYDRTVGAVTRCLRRRGVALRSASERRRTHLLNEAAFDDVLSDPVAQYWVGMVAGDGCVQVRERGQQTLSLTLTLGDRDHVRAFGEFLGASHPVSIERRGGYENSQPSARIVVTSRRLCQALAAYGVVPEKSLTFAVRHLESSAAFWRGCVDSDGYLMYEREDGLLYPGVGMVGPRRLLEQFSAFIRVLLPDCPATVHPMHGIWSVCVTGQRALALASALYADKGPCLPRKRRIFERMLSWTCGRRDWSWLSVEKLDVMLAKYGSWDKVAKRLRLAHATVLRIRQGGPPPGGGG